MPSKCKPGFCNGGPALEYSPVKHEATAEEQLLQLWPLHYVCISGDYKHKALFAAVALHHIVMYS